MGLLRVMLKSLLFSILIAAGAFLAVFIITYGLTESIIPATVGAAIGFLWSYSYFLASSDYQIRGRYEDLVKETDALLHRWMRNGLIARTMNLPGKGGRRISVDAYHICQKIFKFN